MDVRSRRRWSLCFLVPALALAVVPVAVVIWRSLPGGPLVTESSSEPGLVWLARHQDEDGGWTGDVAPSCSECTGTSPRESRVRVTGETLLAFLGAGYTPQNRASFVDKVDGKTRRYGETVRTGVKFLLARATPQGFDGAGDDLLAQSMATEALTEAYGITNAVAYRGPAQTAVAALQSAALPGGGWAAVRGGPFDVLATVWALDALKSAEIGGLTSDDGVRLRALEALEASRPPEGKTPGEARALELWRAARIFGAIFQYKKRDAMPWGQAEAEALAATAVAGAAQDQDVRLWATLALFQWDGPKGPCWKGCHRALADGVLARQRPPETGCLWGSFDPDICQRPGTVPYRSRVEATALSILALEVYYRYATTYGDKK